MEDSALGVEERGVETGVAVGLEVRGYETLEEGDGFGAVERD